MKRPSLETLSLYCTCPNCANEITYFNVKFYCQECKSNFETHNGSPVLLAAHNSLFKPKDYTEPSLKTTDDRGSRIKSFLKFIKTNAPSRSLNLARDKVFNQLVDQIGNKEFVILVIGCGNQLPQIKQKFSNNNITFVFCDIDIHADVDVFADAHHLPFHNDTFDALITTAVLEHVLYPEKVVSEIERVLKFGAYIYSEIPFLQSVHEGAYDFTRYTMSGHRRLLEQFNEIDAGMVAGPATALVWSLCDFSRSIVKPKALSLLLFLLVRYALSWIKYFDYIIKNNPIALDFASATYFFGTKSNNSTPPEAIIRKYRNSNFSHI